MDPAIYLNASKSKNENVLISFEFNGGSTMKNIKVLGIDLAKNVFQIHGTDAKGKAILRKRLSRSKFMEFIANQLPCIIGIEACGGSHYWARYCKQFGHEVRMMAPQFVKPYVKSNKNDRNDSEGIAEACTRPSMRFVPIKTMAQQDILMIHRARELSIKNRTAQSNQIRSFLNEYGVIMPQGIRKLKELIQIIEEHKDKLTPISIELIVQLYEQFNQFDAQVKGYDRQITLLAKQNNMCQEIQKMQGVGPLIASAIVSTIGDPKVFKNGREVSAWLGLTPRQYSSGEKIVLGGISKRGDSYMRKLLIQGARNAVKVCGNKKDKLSCWVTNKKERGGFNKAAVALANKNVRMIWAIMSTGECYRHP
jgi:transposase